MDTTQPTRSAPHTDTQPAPMQRPNTIHSADLFSGKVTSYPGAMSSEDAAPAAPAEDFLANARDTNGTRVVRSKLTGSEVVSYNGMEVQVSSLEAQGILTKGPNGYELAEAKPQAEAKPEAKPTADAAEAFDAQAEALAGGIAGKTSTTTQLAAIADWTRNGAVSPSTINAMASEMGTNPAEAEALVSELMEAFQAQASARLAGYGPVDEVMAFAKAHAPSELAAAMRQHATERTTKGYAAVGQAYMEALDTTEAGRAAILAGEFGDGLKAEVIDGTVVLSHPTAFQGQVSWKTAIRNGYIKPHLGSN